MIAATLFLVFLNGIIIGWVSHDVFIKYIDDSQQPFNKLFQENPHPELFNDQGKIIKDDYMALNFELGYSPDDFDPEDIHDDS